MTRLFSYVMTSDTGFAPAMDRRGRFLTLCTCMKNIRDIIDKQYKGDKDLWVLGTVGKGLAKKARKLKEGDVVYLAKVTDTPTIAQYSKDRRFAKQRDRVYSPLRNKFYCEGPYNGYFSVPKRPKINGKLCNPHCKEQRDKDTSVDMVLVSRHFYYFGRRAKTLSKKYQQFASGANSSTKWRMKYKFEPEDVGEFIRFAENNWKPNRYGDSIEPNPCKSNTTSIRSGCA